jgi:N-acetylmuramoyl-L-alanine amidase
MEGEFIHTKHGAAFIKNPDNRQKMAQAVFDGVMDYKKENF